MKTKCKRNISIALLGTLLVAAVPMPIMAQSNDSTNYQQQSTVIQPRLQYISQSQNGFGINDGVAEVDCWVNGNVLTATKAKVIAELQVKNGSNWIPVKIWTDTQNGYEAYVYESYNVTEGHTYRVKATFYVWEGSNYEDLTVISREKTA